jgi:hypothetical protein
MLAHHKLGEFVWFGVMVNNHSAYLTDPWNLMCYKPSQLGEADPRQGNLQVLRVGLPKYLPFSLTYIFLVLM